MENPEQNNEPRRFGSDGKKCGDWRRSTLVDVWHPDLERHGRNFESETDDDQQYPEQGRALVGAASSKRRGYALEIRLTSNTKNPGDTVNDEPGGHAAAAETNENCRNRNKSA